MHDCLESFYVEKQIHTILDSYCYKKNREFFVLKFNILKKVVERYCRRNNVSIEDFKKDIEEDNKITSPEFSDFIPEPVTSNQIELPEKRFNQITNYFSHM